MRARLWIVGWCAGIAAGSAQAPESADGTATRAVRAIARTAGGQLARYGADICVDVRGNGGALDSDIKTRLEARAHALGLHVEGPGCAPNLELVVAPDARAFIRAGLASRAGQFRAASAAEAAGLTAIDAPIIVWTRTAARGRDGGTVSVGSLTVDGVVSTAPTAVLSVPTASLLGHKVRQVIVNGAVVLDRAAAQGKSAQQLADYAAMRLLGNSTDAIVPFDSILRLFAGDWRSAGQLTSFDLLYLDSLYRSPAFSDAVSVTAAMGHRIGQAAGMIYDNGHLRPAPAQVASESPDAVAERVLQAAISPAAAPPRSAMPPVDAQPDWGDVVTITAPRAGPPLWRVRKGDATIVILGTIAPMPPDLTWTDYRIRSALRRSKRMLINSDPETGYLYMRRWTPEAARRLHQAKGRTLFAELDAGEASRLRAIAAAIGQDDTRYADLRPVAAVMLLNWDWRQHSGLTNLVPARPLIAQARQYRVTVHIVPQLALLPTLDALPGMPPEAQRACFDRLLSTIENERSRAIDQARAWAKGDLGRLRASYIAPANCTTDIPADAQRRAAAIAAWNRTLLRALDSHDQSFAVIDLSNLLSRDGILAQLRAEGAQVDIPPDEVPSSSAREPAD